MKLITRALIPTLAAASLAAPSAGAASFYFNKFPVHSSSEATCYSFARSAANGVLTNIRFTKGLEVAGVKGVSYVSITCVGRGGNQPALAIVMVASDNPGEAVSVRDQISTRLKGTQNID